MLIFVKVFLLYRGSWSESGAQIQFAQILVLLLRQIMSMADVPTPMKIIMLVVVSHLNFWGHWFYEFRDIVVQRNGNGLMWIFIRDMERLDLLSPMKRLLRMRRSLDEIRRKMGRRY